MKRYGSSAIALVLALALGLAACGGSNNEEASSGDDVALTQGSDLTFAMVTHSDESTFWTVVKAGAEAAAKDQGVKLSWSPAGNEAQKQAQLIEAAVSQKVDGIAVSVPNADAIKGALAKATSAGIPIVTLNSGEQAWQTLGAITHVGQDERVAGNAAGQRFKEAGVKKVMCIVHEQGNVGLEDRCAGVKAGFGGTVTNVQVKGTSDLATTGTEIRSKLQADKSYDQLITLNPDVSQAAKTAIKGAGSSAKLATFDLSPAVIGDVQAGTIEFAVDQQQYLQGYLPLVFLKLYKQNANTVGGGRSVLTGPGFVDKSNAATVAKLAEAGTR